MQYVASDLSTYVSIVIQTWTDPCVILFLVGSRLTCLLIGRILPHLSSCWQDLDTLVFLLAGSWLTCLRTPSWYPPFTLRRIFSALSLPGRNNPCFIQVLELFYAILYSSSNVCPGCRTNKCKVEDVTEGERQRAKQVLTALVWCPSFYVQ